MEKFITFLGIFLYAVILAGAVSFFTGLLVWWLWNWLMPLLFGLPTLTYIQAWGISWLCSLLFKGSHIDTKKD